MSATPRVSAIILAGGRSARFGTDKLEADLDGRTVLDHVIDAVAALADEIVVVGRSGRRPGVRYVPDDEPGSGPLAGLASGLGAIETDVALVVGGDMPLLRADVLRRLVSALGGLVGAEAAVLAERGVARPLPIAVRRDPGLAAVTASLDLADRSLRGFLGKLEVHVVAESDWRPFDPDGLTLLDVDTPGDLETLTGRGS